MFGTDMVEESGESQVAWVGELDLDLKPRVLLRVNGKPLPNLLIHQKVRIRPTTVPLAARTQSACMPPVWELEVPPRLSRFRRFPAAGIARMGPRLAEPGLVNQVLPRVKLASEALAFAFGAGAVLFS